MTRDNRPSPQSDQICHSGDKMNMGQKIKANIGAKLAKYGQKLGQELGHPVLYVLFVCDMQDYPL